MIHAKDSREVKSAPRISDCLIHNPARKASSALDANRESEKLMSDNRTCLAPIAGSNSVAKMGKFPVKKQQQLRGKKNEPLILEITRISIFGYRAMKCDNWQRCQISVVIQLLSCSVMLIVLIVPKCRTAGNAQRKEECVNKLVETHVAEKG